MQDQASAHRGNGGAGGSSAIHDGLAGGFGQPLICRHQGLEHVEQVHGAVPLGQGNCVEAGAGVHAGGAVRA
eukprot:1139015-Pelagomonas_calceolata.AAC.9